MIVLISFGVFCSYYLASTLNFLLKSRYFFILLFVSFAVVLRIYIEPERNKDYFAYNEVYDYREFDLSIFYFLSEPYLSLLIQIFSFYSSNNQQSLLIIYWINFLVTLFFFVRVILWDDMSFWKKIFLFSYCFVPFAFVLLRNSIPYILVCFYLH